MYQDSETNKCDKLTSKLSKKLDFSGLIGCNRKNDKCNYQSAVSNKTITKDCECSKNSEGTSFCDKDHTGILFYC